jgi:cytochrome b pre-mRNA-processing protein 3
MNIAEPAQAALPFEDELNFFRRIFGSRSDRDALAPLYSALVERGRDPFWYRNGVPDTLDGRFDMIAAVTAIALLRLEAEGESARNASILLTEMFVADMDSSLRQIGIGDYVVGKHVGRMMGALGGRLTAFRAGLAKGDLGPATLRNIFHESPPGPACLEAVAAELAVFAAMLAAIPIAQLLQGKLDQHERA